MIELPEAAVLAKQINEAIGGKKIKNVIAAQSPHKLAWYFGDPQEYKKLLTGKVISNAVNYGGQVEITADKTPGNPVPYAVPQSIKKRIWAGAFITVRGARGRRWSKCRTIMQ